MLTCAEGGIMKRKNLQLSVTDIMTGEQVRRMREELCINQTEFWARVGMTQSAGSRYESGRKIPKPVSILLTITYGKNEVAEALLASLRQGVARPAPQ